LVYPGLSQADDALDGVGPNDGVADFAGWAWLVILPLVGGAVGVVWLGVVILWAPCVFVVRARNQYQQRLSTHPQCLDASPLPSFTGDLCFFAPLGYAHLHGPLHGLDSAAAANSEAQAALPLAGLFRVGG
jgi:hypothetical protein